MKNFKGIYLIFSFLSSTFFSLAQNSYWQQEVNYNIQVELNTGNHTLAGQLSLVYTNNSPDKLNFIWFHLWPNAYKDKNTALFKQLQNSESRKEKVDSVTEMGFITELDWKVNNQKATTIPHEEYADIVKVMLPEILLPGGSITISTPFKVKLPDYFSRLGFKNAEHMITQWYPKPAVYDVLGWHPIPYLDLGEFYSEFGSFKVDITVPANYVVAATGTLLDIDEYEKYKEIGAKNYAVIKTAINNNDSSDYNKLISKLEWYKPMKNSLTKTLHYSAQNVHDFAWFADTNFVINYDNLKLYTQKRVDAFTFYHKESIDKWMMSCNYVKDAVSFYTINVGEYPYAVVNAVEGPVNSGSGGMEYPMVTLITQPDASHELLDAIITHEVGHNWFYGILGNNERFHPWMDEGMNTFFQYRYEATKYKANSILPPTPSNLLKLSVPEFETIIYKSFTQIKIEDKIDKEATAYETDELYGGSVYMKAAMWMHLLEMEMGKEDFQKGIEMYFEKWKFKHPYPEDFRKVMEDAAGKSLKKIFKMLNQKGSFTRDDF